MKMIKFRVNKLIRDGIPALMSSKGSITHCRKLDDAEFDRELRLKLLEEAQEVLMSTSKEELIGELADLLEVIEALQKLHDIKQEQVLAVKAKKLSKRGGFDKRTFATTTEHPEGSSGEQYCRAQPDKYPEIG